MGTNTELKRSNVLKVYQALRSRNTLSRKDLERITGLSWGSISVITGDLIAKQFLSAEKESSLAGRPPEKLTVHPSRRLSLGVDVNSVGLSFDLVNLAGRPVFSVFEPVRSRKKEDVLSMLAARSEEIIARYRDVIGINVSMQGALDRTTGTSLRTNFFEDWHDVPLVNFFESKFGLPTRLYHDPECLLAFHLCTDERLRDCTNVVVIRIDEGIGMARQTVGNLGESAEIGHTVVEPDGMDCLCGRRGCLEAYSSLRGMKNLYAEATGVVAEDILPVLISGDEAARAIRRQASGYLGLAIANLCTLLSPDYIVLDGVAIVRIPGFYEEIKSAAEGYLKGDAHLLRADYRRDAASIGASLLAIEATLEEILFSGEN